MQTPFLNDAYPPALKRLADSLGVSPATFYDPITLAQIDVQAEFVRLWEALDSDAGRQAVLGIMRAIVSAQSG